MGGSRASLSRHPGRRPGIHRAAMVPPAIGVNRCGRKERIATGAYLQQARVDAHYVVMVSSLDSRLRGNDEWEGPVQSLSCHPERRVVPLSRHPGHHKKSRHPEVSSSRAERSILVSSSRASIRDPRSTDTVRAGLQRTPPSSTLFGEIWGFPALRFNRNSTLPMIFGKPV